MDELILNDEEEIIDDGYFSVNTDLGLNQVGGYVLSISKYSTEEDKDKNIFNFDLSQYDFVNALMQAYILRDNYLEFDPVRNKEMKDEMEEQQKHEKPTYEEKIEAQLTYTAMMTDTLLEEEDK